MRAASHDCFWKVLPTSDITFHNVRNNKAFYAQSCLLIWFIVFLSLKILFKSPQGAFFAKKRGHAHY